MSNNIWNRNNPAITGYYMVTWLRGKEKRKTVSELWFDKSTDKWWANRGYLTDRFIKPSTEIKTVIAWCDKPEPA